MTSRASAAWRRALEAWAIPDDLLAAAPESPYGFPTGLFERAAREALEARSGVSRERALEALGGGGTVLDVGVGGGAASLPLVPSATHITGIDESPGLLASFARSAGELGVDHDEVRGRWPDVAPEVTPADVVVCHHVFYNAPDLDAFALSLTDKARKRVVVELTADHPMSGLNDLWMHFHGLRRPEEPSAEDAIAVLEENGIHPVVERWERPSLWTHAPDERVAFVRKRLCLTPDHDEAIERMVGDRLVAPRHLVTIWWNGRADASGRSSLRIP